MISGSIWGSFQGWGSFRGRDHLGVGIISGSGSFWGLYRAHSFIHVTGVGSESPFTVNESCSPVCIPNHVTILAEQSN